MADGQLRFLAFYDLAHLENDADDSPVVTSDQAGQVIASADVASIGAGLRWTWRENLSVQADAAVVTRGEGSIEKDDSKVHLGLFYRF